MNEQEVHEEAGGEESQGATDDTKKIFSFAIGANCQLIPK